jgi:hypothetical protein
MGAYVFSFRHASCCTQCSSLFPAGLLGSSKRTSRPLALTQSVSAHQAAHSERTRVFGVSSPRSQLNYLLQRSASIHLPLACLRPRHGPVMLEDTEPPFFSSPAHSSPVFCLPPTMARWETTLVTCVVFDRIIIAIINVESVVSSDIVFFFSQKE